MSTPPSIPRWGAWRVVIGFGIVSLAVDLVADGARSIQGPLLASLGASALMVGLVTGGAEAAGYGLRLRVSERSEELPSPGCSTRTRSS